MIHQATTKPVNYCALQTEKTRPEKDFLMMTSKFNLQASSSFLIKKIWEKIIQYLEKDTLI